MMLISAERAMELVRERLSTAPEFDGMNVGDLSSLMKVERDDGTWWFVIFELIVEEDADDYDLVSDGKYFLRFMVSTLTGEVFYLEAL